MTKTYLYHQIAESIRQDILHKTLQPGDRAPSLREMAARWNCTIGTVQRAYEALAQQGLLISHPGQGTRVAATIPADETLPLRRAMLVHRAEAFLLEMFTAGYTQVEVEQAMRLALDRWRSLKRETVAQPAHHLHFVGSHDPAVAMIAAHFAEMAPGYIPHLTFAGSLGGLMALAAGEADLAGSHLWDEESDTYNVPFIRKLLLGRQVALLTLAHRRLGLILSPGESTPITGLQDLAHFDLRFINRQRGAGTRVWLDAQLHRLGIAPERIAGYDREAQTHSEAAQQVAEGDADVGLCIEAAALAYGLTFIPLTTERYDLVIPAEIWETPSIQAIVHWLLTAEAKQSISALGGYDLSETGRVEWIGN